MRIFSMLFMFVAISAMAQQETLSLVQVYGEVRDAASGATVYCTVEQYDKDGKRQALTTVNSDGRFAFFVPAAESFTLRVAEENGYAPLERYLEAISAGSKPQRIDLLLKPQ